MKKILIIQHYGGIGGSGIGLLGTIYALKEQYDIKIYCPGKPDSLYKYYKDLGINVEKYDFNNFYFSYYNGGAPWYSKSFIRSLLNIKNSIKYWGNVLIIEKPNLIIVNSMVMSWIYKAIGALKCKTICHVRETLPTKNSLLGKIMLSNLNKFDGIMFISEFDKKYFTLKNPKQAIVRDCLRPDKNNSYKKSDKISRRLLYVGGSDQIKGLDVLLESIQYIYITNYIIDIAGYIQPFLLDKNKRIPIVNPILSYHYRRLKKLLNNKEIQAKINIIGQCIDITEFYKNCDVVIFPSKKPHQSRPILEAGEFAKPVIASEFNQTKESIIPYYNGLVFKPNNPKRLAQCINILYTDLEKMHKMGTNNFKNTILKHTFEDVSKITRKFVELILQ